jgi:hypothetical protein
MKIETFETFYAWLDTNYDKLTDEQYIQIVQNCISVFESEKPTDKEIGLKRIKEFWNKYGHLEETPLFLDINNI